MFPSSFTCNFSKIVCLFDNAYLLPESYFCFQKIQMFHTLILLNRFTDDESVLAAAKVVEAAGAKYIGLVIILLISVPFGVMIITDLTSCNGRNKPRCKPRLPRKSGRIITTTRQ